LLVLAAVFVGLAAGRLSGRRLRVAAAGLVVAAALAYPNFGFFHVYYRSPIHWWDAYHYFMGAKYLPELGYSRLYEATWLAGREMGAFAGIRVVRDLGTYAPRDVATIDAAAVRARFSPARWQAFKRDLLVFGPRLPNWDRLFLDHGYNDPPPRALVLHLLVRAVPASPASLAVLTSLDYALVLLAFWAVWRAFGAVPAALAFASFGLSFFARFDFVGGSLLRWDWIAALLLGVAALARGAGGAAGLCFGYAALARIFPVLFLVPLAIKWAQARGRDAVVGRCLAAAAGLCLVAGAGMVLAPGARALAEEFAGKIGLHSQAALTNHVGLGALLTFHAAPWTMAADGSMIVPQAAALAARPAPWVLPAATLVCALVVLPLVLRARPLQSLLYALPLIFCAVSPAGYYYSFLVLLVLLPWRDGVADAVRLLEMALLALVMAADFGFELLSTDWVPLFYRVTLLLGVFFVVWLGLEYLRLAGAERRWPWVPAPAPPPTGGG
jgi:hypothetical protein